MITFYRQSEEVTEKIRKRIVDLISNIEEIRIRNVLMQRTKSASFIKGVLAYHIHQGLGGTFNDVKRIDFSSKLEIFCSAGAILDNVIDRHEERNGETTYFREYGLNIQLAASQYALHHGLRLLFPFLETFSKKYSEKYKVDQAVLGMVKTDIDVSSSLEEHLQTIGLSNGLFNEIPLVMAASLVTEDDSKIDSIGKYGLNLGIALGIYEELRDFLGKHGRRRATEIEGGRIITPLHLVREFDFSYYLGRQLSEEDYTTLFHELKNRGALNETKNLVLLYFQKAAKHLESAVNKDCMRRIRPLQDSVEDSMNRMLFS